MNFVPSRNSSYESNFDPQRERDPLRHLLVSAHSTLEQAPPPTLREILSAYRTKGDGDREMLLALLNAKTAEDERLSSVVSLQRTMLDIYRFSPPEPHHAISSNRAHHYFSPVTGPPAQISRPSSHRYHRCVSSRSRSPSRSEVIRNDSSDRPSKRLRLSRSPPTTQHPTSRYSCPPEHYPLSPHSSERSDSADYSPRSRNSMTIGSLLSTHSTRMPEDVSHRKIAPTEPS